MVSFKHESDVPAVVLVDLGETSLELESKAFRISKFRFKF